VQEPVARGGEIARDLHHPALVGLMRDPGEQPCGRLHLSDQRGEKRSLEEALAPFREACRTPVSYAGMLVTRTARQRFSS